MPKVSVVVPIYGVENFIEKCCISLFEQTLDDIEYIFVDDCTPDNSINILKRVLEKYPQRNMQVKILHNNRNLGIALTRKKGIEAASGKYIIHCDPDDWVALSAYEKMYNYAIEENLDIVSCEFYKVDQTGKLIFSNEIADNDIVYQLLLGQKQGALWNRLVKSNIVRTDKVIYPQKGMAEDLVLVLQYYHYANRVGIIAEPLYYYYQNPTSVSSFGNAEKLIDQAMQMKNNIETLERFFIEEGISKKYSKEMIARKFFCKRWILPTIRNAKGCSQWIKLHRDINLSLYFNPYLSMQDKITSILVVLRLYPLFRRIIRKR